MYLTIVNNSAGAAIFTRKESAAFDELAESADFEATAAELAVEPGAHNAFIVEWKVGTEYNPILFGPCTIKDNHRTFLTTRQEAPMSENQSPTAIEEDQPEDVRAVLEKSLSALRGWTK